MNERVRGSGGDVRTRVAVRPQPEVLVRTRVRQPEAVRVRIRTDEPERTRLRFGSETVTSSASVNERGATLGYSRIDAFDIGGFGGFSSGAEGAVGAAAARNPQEQEQRTQDLFTILAQVLQEAAIYQQTAQTVYLPDEINGRQVILPGEYFSEGKKRILLRFDSIFMRGKESGEKIKLRVGFARNKFRDGKKISPSVYEGFTQNVRETVGKIELGPFGLLVEGEDDVVDRLPAEQEGFLPDVSYGGGRFRRPTRLYRSPEGLRKFFEGYGITGENALAPILYTLLRAGRPISPEHIREAAQMGAISVGVVDTNLLFVPMGDKVFCVNTDKAGLLDWQTDVPNVLSFLQEAYQAGMFAQSGSAVEVFVSQMQQGEFQYLFSNESRGRWYR